MDIIESPPYRDMQILYRRLFTTGYLNTDINTKFALIALVGHLVFKLKQKVPDVTSYRILKQLSSDIPEDFLKGLAVVCDDFAYGCKEFPTFGLEDKKIPSKIKEILNTWMPF